MIYINGLGGYLITLVVVGIAASCRDEMFGMETGFDFNLTCSLITDPSERLDLFGESSFTSTRPTQVTWLILPVVICLSQRLSHACLSLSDLNSETADGSLYQL